ncbi:hypothetical protein B9Z36_07035 [Limnohabitans sp. Rim8]|jgi:hypothetical protein|uniref:hypothetical protein n=1 Tax=Limnohabitans sp. Rim8 TaxID=1100718 RepID=UPI000D3AB8AE|nr:hypothetical protein [Limnohabitans sp. Rim8]PUE57666.1 hypothetical protein B9Z36_07035 [Limnohabitans sp. Rim8]
MHFLNVYPKRLWATLNPVGAFEGQFTFDLEQYGLLTSDIVCETTIAEDPIVRGQWTIVVKPMLNVEMPHFDKFVDTLNHYVFEVLQFMPSRTALGKDLPMVKLFFDGIYFDMSGSEPVVQKIGAAPLKE